MGPGGLPGPIPFPPLGDIFCLDFGLGWLGMLPLYPILGWDWELVLRSGAMALEMAVLPGGGWGMLGRCCWGGPGMPICCGGPWGWAGTWGGPVGGAPGPEGENISCCCPSEPGARKIICPFCMNCWGPACM